MTNTSSSVASVTRKTSTVLLCLGLLAAPLTACSSSTDNGKGSAGEGSVIGAAGASAASGDSAGATGNSAGATGSSAGAPGSAGAMSGNSDFVADCNMLIGAECHQIYTCVSAADRAKDPANLGTTEAECGTMLEDCSGGTSPCVVGFTFDPAQFATCISALKALSCADFLAVSESQSGAPDECATVCK